MKPRDIEDVLSGVRSRAPFQELRSTMATWPSAEHVQGLPSAHAGSTLKLEEDTCKAQAH